MVAQINRYAEKLAAALTGLVVTDQRGDSVANIDNILISLRLGARVGGKTYLVGNGASATIASHVAADLNKVCRIPALTLLDPGVFSCFSNDYGYEYSFAGQLMLLGTKHDTLIAISSSGKSPNVLNAAKHAKGKGMAVVTFTGFEATNPLRFLGDCNFWVPANEYGLVEVSHTAILHSMIDDFAEYMSAK